MSVGEYDHLPPPELGFTVDLDKLATTLLNTNYGNHRMLSAMVKAWHVKHPGNKPIVGYDYCIMPKIEELLSRSGRERLH